MALSISTYQQNYVVSNNLSTFYRYVGSGVASIEVKSETVNNLQWLEVKCNIMREVDALGGFLQEVGDNLMHLAVDISELFRSQQGTSLG